MRIGSRKHTALFASAGALVALGMPLAARAGWLDALFNPLDFVIGVINTLLSIVTYFLGVFLGFAGIIANYLLTPGSIINATLVQVGWTVTRDFANMLFILILLGIALDFILINSFRVKQMLPRLLLIALLINFSLPIAGLLLDFANVFANFFLTQIADTNNPNTGFTAVLAENMKLQLIFDAGTLGSADTQTILDAQLKILLDQVFAVIFLLGSIFVVLALALMFLIRTGFLYVLLILLPVVLVLYAFPPTSGYFGRWSHKFVQWTMFAPVAAFFLYLAMLTFEGMVNSNTYFAATAGPYSGLLHKAYTFIVVWFFLLGALIAAQQMGIKTAGAAMGALTRTGKWARGKLSAAAGRGAGAAARRMNVGEKLGQAAEFVGKAPIIGGFAARRVGGVAERLRKAEQESAELSANDKRFAESAGEEAIMGTIQGHIGKGTTAVSNAKAAKYAAEAIAKDKFVVRDAAGNIDDRATWQLKYNLYKHAKVMGDEKTMKIIADSDFRVRDQARQDKFAKITTRRVNPRTQRPEKYDADSGLYESDATEKTFRGIKPKEIAELNDVQMVPAELDMMVRNMFRSKAMTFRHLQEAVDNGRWEFIKMVKQSIRAAGATPGTIGDATTGTGLYKLAPALAKHIDNSPGAGEVLGALTT